MNSRFLYMTPPTAKLRYLIWLEIGEILRYILGIFVGHVWEVFWKAFSYILLNFLEENRQSETDKKHTPGSMNSLFTDFFKEFWRGIQCRGCSGLFRGDVGNRGWENKPWIFHRRG